MLAVWGILTILFGGLCEFFGRRAGFPVSMADFIKTASVYILPNMLMIASIYGAAALIFKNPLPAVPLLFLYLIYSNMGSIGPDGDMGIMEDLWPLWYVFRESFLRQRRRLWHF